MMYKYVSDAYRAMMLILNAPIKLCMFYLFLKFTPALPFQCQNGLSQIVHAEKYTEALLDKEKWHIASRDMLQTGVSKDFFQNLNMIEMMGPVLTPAETVLLNIDGSVVISPQNQSDDCVVIVLGYHDNWEMLRKLHSKVLYVSYSCFYLCIGDLPTCHIVNTYCRRIPFPLPHDITDRVKILAACNNAVHKSISWEAVIRETHLTEGPTLVIADPTGRDYYLVMQLPAHLQHRLMMVNNIVFNNWILHDILDMPSHLPYQINVHVKREEGGGSRTVEMLQRMYLVGGYIPVHNTPTNSEHISQVLFARLLCGEDLQAVNIAIAATGIEGDPRTAKMNVLQMVRQKYDITLLPLIPAKKYMSKSFQNRNRPVGKTIHQTTRSAQSLSQLSAPAVYAVNTWSLLNPDWDHVMWFDEDIAVFIRRFFPRFISAFVTLNGVQRSDFFRYLVVYRYGGVYADLDVICLQDIASLIKLSTRNHSIEMQSMPAWRDQVLEGQKKFPHHQMIKRVATTTFHTDLAEAEPVVLWFSNGNVTAAIDTEANNILYIGEERTTAHRPDSNLLYPIQYLQWWFMASEPKHSALLYVVTDIAFKAKSMHIDINRPTRRRAYNHRNQFTLWLTGIVIQYLFVVSADTFCCMHARPLWIYSVYSEVAAA